MKVYFDNEDEGGCYGLKYFKESMKETGADKMELWQGVREIGEDHFFCSHFGEVGLKSEGGCGKLCDEYSPCNGKSGRCRHSKNTYFPGDKYILELKDGKFTLKKEPA